MDIDGSSTSTTSEVFCLQVIQIVTYQPTGPKIQQPQVKFQSWKEPNPNPDSTDRNTLFCSSFISKNKRIQDNVRRMYYTNTFNILVYYILRFS